MNSKRIRFQADADFDMIIVRGLRRIQPAIDIQLSDEAGLRGLPDTKVLEIAAQHARILLSHDKRTMPIHFGSFIAQGFHSPGVILIKQNTPFQAAVEALHLVWLLSEPEEWENRLVYMP